MKLMSCGSCDYYVPVSRGEGKFGECHLDARRLSTTTPGSWPLTYAKTPGCSKHSELESLRRGELLEALRVIGEAIEQVAEYEDDDGTG